MKKENNMNFDKSWTLFLDRDVVINKRRVDDYVKSWDEFEFLPGVLESLKIFAEVFGRIVVVTNQQGIGKGVMTEKTLQEIHEKMKQEIEQAGGRLDAVFHCPDLQSKPGNCRKPDTAMFEKARTRFPEIKPEKSLMIGDSESDILFGKNAGMQTLFVGDKPHPLVDYFSSSLKDFARQLISSNL